MLDCPYPGCGWRAIAPSADAARWQVAEHVLNEHAHTDDGAVAEERFRIRLERDGDWITASLEPTREAHEATPDE